MFILLWSLAMVGADKPTSPIPEAEIKALHDRLDKEILDLTEKLKKQPSSVRFTMDRGMANLLRGKFTEAAADFDRTIELDPTLAPSHWQRGIALYYAGRYKESADQFEQYQSHDDVDRENGLWRFFAQARSEGAAAARKKLVRYVKEDRAPLPDVYRMFELRLSPEDVLRRVERRSGAGTRAREMEMFYADLYLGFFHEFEKHDDLAQKHLVAAVKNPWPKRAGGGPEIMWHVARLEEERFRTANAKK